MIHWSSNPLLLVIAGLILLTGVGLLVLHLRPRRNRHATCPKCRYDTSAQLAATSPKLQCPECGTTVASPAQWLTRRRPPRLLLVLAALLILASPICATWPWAFIRTARLVLPSHEVVDSVRFAPFSAQLMRLSWDYDWLTDAEKASDFTLDVLVISGPEGEVVRRSIWHPTLGVHDWSQLVDGAAATEPMPALGRGTDVTGDGILDLAVSEPTGGSSNTITVYSLDVRTPASGSRPRFVPASFTLENGCLHDFDGDGVAEFVTFLPDFKHAFSSRAEGTEPVFVLRRERASGQYRFDLPLTAAHNVPRLAALPALPAADHPEPRVALLQHLITNLAACRGDVTLSLLRVHGGSIGLDEADFRHGVLESMGEHAWTRDWMSAQPEAFRVWLGPVPAAEPQGPKG
jgi:hypothetical protein